MLALFVLLLFPLSTHAETLPKPVHALAIHGTPKYAEDFKSFDYVNAGAPKGGTLKLGIVGTFDSLNPWIIRGNVPQPMIYTTDTLMARAQDEPFALYGLVADKVVVPADRSSITFYLRANASWQDGQPITAAPCEKPESTIFVLGQAAAIELT